MGYSLYKFKNLTSMIDEQAAMNKWGKTHHVTKRARTEPDLRLLKEGESVVYGDGETYHWLITKKDKQADVDAYENS